MIFMLDLYCFQSLTFEMQTPCTLVPFRCDHWSSLKCFCLNLTKEMFPHGLHSVLLSLKVSPALTPRSLFQGLGGGGDHQPGELLLQTKEAQHDFVQPRLGDKGKSRSEKVFQARLKALCGKGQRAAMHRHDLDHHPLVQRPRQLQHRHHQL